ncbi:DUF349 domain-containing protein [Candidatus Marithrix sp. Canyon 246]|uniref:DUF349 domain-containing protein n=3 Tax=Candidatus Marithrix sp. Canyon 246 TaxID=1827136 RepID=UPI00084A0A1B|nr:DUF349 domain-containing protein [Candidatus Marithrix sp. Canyon 246]
MILSNFIKPKWQHSNPNIRRSVIDGLDDTAILHEIAQNDTAAEVRQAALKKINDLNILDTIVHNDNDKNVQAVAQQRIKQLLCTQFLSLEQRIAWINKTNDAEQIAEVATKAEEVELRLAAIAKLEREGLLGDIVINDSVSEVRLTVLEKLTQKSTLERVVKATRNTDKRLYRRAREKLDEVIEQIERPARVYAEYEAICTKLNALEKRLNSGMSDVQMTSKNAKLLKTQQLEFNNLKKTWLTIAEYAEPECQSRYTELEQKVKLAFEKHEQALKAIQAREEVLAPIRESKQTVSTKLEALLIDLKKHQSLDNKTHEDFTEKFTALETEWNYIPTLDDSDEESNWQARFKRFAEAIQKRHQNLRQIYQATEQLEALCNETDKLLSSKVTTEQLTKLKARWQKVHLPEPAVELNNRFKKNMTALEQRLQAQNEKHKQTVNKLKTLLNELEATLEKGELKTAISLDEKATKLLKTIKDKSNRALLDKRLQQCKLKINELRSWQSWGGKVERENLCQKISNLLETEETAEKLLEMVLQAQEAWKKLGSSGYSQQLWKQFNDNCQQVYRKYREDLCQQVEELQKTSADKPEESAKVINNYQQTWKNLGSQGNSDQIWKRFNDACQTAYEPCKAYFHDKSNQREQNLLQKQALSEQLETYANNTDWQNVEWKQVSNFVRDAENKWKTIGATDRKFKKSIEKRFNSALQVLTTFLDNERLRNCHQRVQLYLQVVGIVNHFEDFIATNADVKLIESTLNEAIEDLKTLQTQWKVTIPGSRRVEREFWTSFRSSCDKLFNYRQQQIDEQSHELQTYLDKKTAICDEIHIIVNDDSIIISSDQLKQFRDQWQNIKADWKQIGNIARRRKAKAVETVEKRFEAVYKKLRNQYQKQLANEQRDQLDQLRQKAALCAEVEQATEFDDAIQNRWEELAPLQNSEFETAIQQRFQKACNNAEDIVNTKGIEEKQTYCIRMEILAGIDSPAEAAQARLAYQVDRLSAAMSGGEKTSMNPQQEALDIEQNWYLSAAVSREQTKILEQRFNKAYQALQ